jgi:hypothetical protein
VNSILPLHAPNLFFYSIDIRKKKSEVVGAVDMWNGKRAMLEP